MAKLGEKLDFEEMFGAKKIKNINLLLCFLKTRLGTIDESANVFTNTQLVTFLFHSLSTFNQTPKFTNHTFEDKTFVETYADILVHGATINVLAAKSLIERGKEYKMSDNGVVFHTAPLSDLLQSQYQTEIHLYYEKLKRIKECI